MIGILILVCIAHVFPAAPRASGLGLSSLGAVKKQQVFFSKKQESMPKPEQNRTKENPGSCLHA